MRSGSSACGIRYAVRRSGKAVAYCSLSIGCGSRNEEGYPAGIAHFVENTLFRGTRRKSAAVINGFLDRLGGELNAYTTKEEIVLHATVLKEDLWKAVQLLFELASEATFPDAAVETERGVILDEIISCKDNPAEDIYDRFESLLFGGHPLGSPILGTATSVKKITPDMLRRFVAEHFVPERMVLSVVADIDEGLLEKRLLKALDAREAEAGKAPRRPVVPAPLPETAAFRKQIDQRHHEANAVLGCRAPSLYDMPERIAASMLANILGGPASNSLLNKELREKRGWVYGIECSYTQYADSGVMAISFGCDRPHLEACIGAVEKILRQMRENCFSERQMKAFRKQLLGQLAIAGESGEAQCLSMGKSILAWDRVLPDGENRAAIEAVSAEQLRDMAARLFAPERLSSLVYL